MSIGGMKHVYATCTYVIIALLGYYTCSPEMSVTTDLCHVTSQPRVKMSFTVWQRPDLMQSMHVSL